MAVYLGNNQIDMFGGNGIVQPTLQTKTINPSESIQNITADSGYDGLDEVIIQSIPLDHVGSGIDQRDSTDLTINGPTIIVPEGYYENEATKTIANGSAGTPIATKGTVSNHIISVTPSVTNITGYITGGMKTGTAVSVSASELVSGNLAITSNGTNIDVANYATCSVDVSSGWKTATGVITNEGAAGAYPNVATFTVEKEPADWMIMQTKAFTSGTTSSGPTGAVFITPSFCLAAYPNSTSQINFVDKSSYVTERTKSSTSLRIKLNYYQVFFWAGGTYTLYYK